MKSKIIAIFVLMLIITTALPVVGAINSNKVNEKTFSTNSSNDEYGNLVIAVYIRRNTPRVDDAVVTATHLESNRTFILEYRNIDDWEGNWLLQGPVGEYHVQAKRGLKSGSIEIHNGAGLSTGYIYLKFFDTTNVYYELPVLSILRLIFSRLPIFK